MLIGAGDGSVRILRFLNPSKSKLPKSIREITSVCLERSNAKSSSIKVTSMVIESIEIDRITFLIGTDKCDIHRVDYHKSKQW